MRYPKNLFTRWTHYAFKLAFLLSLRLGIGLLVTVLKLKSLAVEDSTRQAGLLILLLAVGFSVIVWLPQLLSLDLVGSAWQKDLSM